MKEETTQYEKAHKTEFDRQLGQCQGMLSTKLSTVTVMKPLAVGGVQFYTVQTYRRYDRNETGRATRSEDTVFLNCMINGEPLQLAIPPKVADTIARQREALTTKARKASAKQKAERDKKAGIVPGFMRTKTKKGGGA